MKASNEGINLVDSIDEANKSNISHDCHHHILILVSRKTFCIRPILSEMTHVLGGGTPY